MTSIVYDDLLKKEVMHQHPATDTTSAEADPLSLHLSQVSPQTVTGGSPVFAEGLTIAADKKVYLDG